MKEVCNCFVVYAIGRSTCKICSFDEEDHGVCSFFTPGTLSDERCLHCGKLDDQHFVCRGFVNANEETDEENEYCENCGLHEEDHLTCCDEFEPSSLHDDEICRNCDGYVNDHRVCEFYVESKDGENDVDEDISCDNCGQMPGKHNLCSTYFGNNCWCQTCGLHEDDHRACGRFEFGDENLCKTCGKDVNHHVWDSFLKMNMQTKYENDSSFSFKKETKARFFVDGKDAFEEIALALEAACREILIADWILSPEIYLRRGPNASVNDRLDRILLASAERGVRIYILAWNETKLAFKFSNGHAKYLFESLHENIKVVTHPEVTPLEWSHHDKFICIDRQLAFTGGLDLAFGRYDTSSHELNDDCHLKCVWPGKDYYNPTIVEINSVHQPFNDIIDRTKCPRMPWHDVYCCLWDSMVANDFFVHFAQRWNHHIKDMQIDDIYPMMLPDLFLDRVNEDPRMANKPIFRRNRCHSSGSVDNNHLPVSSYRTKSTSLLTSTISKFDKYILSLSLKGVNCSTQLLRSICHWSGGVETERSILYTIIDAIKTSKHYIYIENQYFISSTKKTTNPEVPKNQVAAAITDRLRRAIKSDSTFHIFVVVPIQPEGNFRNEALLRFIMCLQYNTIYLSEDSILSTLRKEFPDTDLSKYISFFSLRTWGRLNNKLVTEMIYVHSKLLIIDDTTTILGSPNINDRSLIGTRDSEVAVILKDQEFVDSKMNGIRYPAGKFSRALRCQLWSEHLGITSDIEDPIADSTLVLLKSIATKNTYIYEELFPDINSNRILTMYQLEAKMDKCARISKAYVCDCEESVENLRMLKKVKGHLIWYPYEFISKSSSISIIDLGLGNLVQPKVFM